jgi:coiled-coil domain-containing protein 130
MPFNVWCLGCERHIARGVRFNAEKKQIAKYHSTPIYAFRMKCPSCTQWIEIHTDPRNAEYQVVSGARKKIEEWQPEPGEVASFRSPEEVEQMEKNPFARLEHEVSDHKRAQAIKPHLSALKDAKDAAYRDDWSTSQRLRKQFRKEKAVHQEALTIADDIRKRGGFDLKLLPEAEEDIQAAKEIDFIRPQRDSKRKELLNFPKLDSKSSSNPPLVKKKNK